MSLTRRRFLETTALAGVAATGVASPGKLPTRQLGKTGVSIPTLIMGCGSRFLSYKDEDKALAAVDRALSLGITYLDTAYGYGNGLSEERVGKAIKGRRDSLFLTTKVSAREGGEAQRIIEGSLKRLQTDHFDLLHIHSLLGDEDLADIEKKGNVLDVIHKLRDQKVTRFIGVTAHTDPRTLAKALERHDFDVTQMALNAAQGAMKSGKTNMVINPDMPPSFQTVALPVANRKKMGVIAMKVFAQEHLVGDAPPEKLIAYSLSLPVTAVVIGMPKLEYLEQNAEIVRNFKPMPKKEMRELSAALSSKKRAVVDNFFRDHVDA